MSDMTNAAPLCRDCRHWKPETHSEPSNNFDKCVAPGRKNPKKANAFDIAEIEAEYLVLGIEIKKEVIPSYAKIERNSFVGNCQPAGLLFEAKPVSRGFWRWLKHSPQGKGA